MTSPAPRAVLTEMFQAGLQGGRPRALLAAHGRFEGETFTYEHGELRASLDIPAGGRVIGISLAGPPL